MFIIVMLFWAEVEMRRYDDDYFCNAVLGRRRNVCIFIDCNEILQKTHTHVRVLVRT